MIDYQEQKQFNLQASIRVLETAGYIAGQHGWILARRSDYHFQLYHEVKGWLYNLYPSKQRIYIDPKRKAPFLDFIGERWTLLDVVNEAIKHN